MIINNQECKDCIHFGVCILRNDFRSIKRDLDGLRVTLDDGHSWYIKALDGFSLELKCTNYLNRKDLAAYAC